MALTQEQLTKNNGEFILLVKEINREGFNASLLLDKLTDSDFFSAPASTKYHGAFKGGLVDHSLKVYHNLVKLCEMKGLTYSKDTLVLVSLFHDFYKMNFYETYFINKKVYSETGTKSDENGKFDWKSVSAYKTKDTKDRFIYGTGGQTSEYMLRAFIPLTLEESVAIIHSTAGLGTNGIMDEVVPDVFNKYPLALLLHIADLMASYYDEVYE